MHTVFIVHRAVVNAPPESCPCGGATFRPVLIDRGPHKPLYRTEFIACESCGAMYHRRNLRTLFGPPAVPPHRDPGPPPFRPEVDTSDWKPPPTEVWVDEP